MRAEDGSGCLLYTGVVGRNGYGRFKVDGHTTTAHRAAYEVWIGPIPDGYQVDHVAKRGCVHRNCIEPAHLEAVTPRENTLRSTSKSAINAQKTHCIRGHEFTEDNTYMFRGHRACRQCRYEQASALRECEYCGKSFGASSMARHTRRAHGIETKVVGK